MREPKERTSDAEQLRLERTAIRQRRRRDEIVVRAEEIASAKSLDGFTAGEVAKRVAGRAHRRGGADRVRARDGAPLPRRRRGCRRGPRDHAARRLGARARRGSRREAERGLHRGGERLAVDRANGQLHDGVADLRRIAMLMNQLVLGLPVGATVTGRSRSRPRTCRIGERPCSNDALALRTSPRCSR